jgi:acetyltransferase-like isoleucine patch superfamily enzyme
MTRPDRWTVGATVTPAHRQRLTAAGVPAELLDSLDLRAIVDADLPGWWPGSGSAIYLAPGVEIPEGLLEKLTLYPFTDVLIVIATDIPHVVSLLVGGDDELIFLGPACALTAAEIYCGAGSSIVLLGHAVATRCAIIDARNGGSIFADDDQLWAADVYVATDDMHRLEDAATGARLNPYGGRIRLGRHVWLCRDVIVTGDVEIGDGAVVGTRAMVRNQKVPAMVAVGGTPARVLREGVTWNGEDRP